MSKENINFTDILKINRNLLILSEQGEKQKVFIKFSKIMG
jgi:hypothetical protein